MLSIKAIGAATVGAVVIGLGYSAAPAQAFSLWSWSFGSSTNGASGTFTTTDVSNPSNPVGTFDVTQFTLSTFRGNSVSAQDTSLRLSPQFVYNTATNYGFINSDGFSDSGGQVWDGGVGTYLLSGSADYEALLPDNRKRANFVILGDNGIAIQNPADLQVSLISPPPPSTAIPTPALLPGLVGMGIAALRKKSKSEQSQQVAETIEA